MLWPTRTTGSGSSASASQIRCAYASSVTSATGVVSSPEPGRSNAVTAWPYVPESSAASGSQHQAPWNAPWTRTNRAMRGSVPDRAGRAAGPAVRERPRLTARVASGAPRRGRGVEDVRGRDAAGLAEVVGQHDAVRRERGAPDRLAVPRRLRECDLRPVHRAKADLGVHLDDARIALGDRRDGRDVRAQRPRLLRDLLAVEQGGGAVVRLGVRGRVEHRARRRHEDAVAPPPDERPR